MTARDHLKDVLNVGDAEATLVVALGSIKALGEAGAAAFNGGAIDLSSEEVAALFALVSRETAAAQTAAAVLIDAALKREADHAPS